MNINGFYWICCFLIVFIICLMILFVNKKIETYTNTTGSSSSSSSSSSSAKKCIALLCHKPHNTWINFLQQFKNYDIFIIVDDNTNVYDNIVKIQNEDCINTGFRNFNYTINKDVTAWEKGLYYLSYVVGYDYMWFIEDDVFIYNEDTLINIDNKYPYSDLLTNEYSEKNDDWYHWKNIDTPIPLPHYSCMCCAIRISKLMLQKIKDYAYNHKTLYFLEAMIPTLCKYNNLRYDNPEELKFITYNNRFDSIDKNYLYHPVKDINSHTLLRMKNEELFKE